MVSISASLAPGNITVTAQQSRFHNDKTATQLTSASKEVSIKDLTLSIGHRELLAHAELHIKSGRRYVLAGRNGIGKSTLLQAIASHQIPGLPPNLQILLLGQTELHDEDRPSRTPTCSVLNRVITSDDRLELLKREHDKLSSPLSLADTSSIIAAFREISHERLLLRLESARLTAQRQSGARGMQARKALTLVEDAVLSSQGRMSRSIHDHSSHEIESELGQAEQMFSEIQQDLETFHVSSIESRAEAILSGLGFSQKMQKQPLHEMSGGWRTRSTLACALFQNSGLLLLDEPTNFLDLPAIMWLERYISESSSSRSIVVVTHDRAFADAVADELIVLRNNQLEYFKGNLSAYEYDRVRQYKYLGRMRAAQDRQKQHMEAGIAYSTRAAQRTGDDKKLKQAASRRKKLDERMGMQVSAKGTRFKLNRDLAGFHLTNRDEIEVPDFDPPVRLVIPQRPAELRVPGALVSLEGASFSYSDGEILRGLSLTVHLGDRVGICGPNGCGKSTLLSMVAGMQLPSRGTVTRHPRARIGLFSQQSAEQLNEVSRVDPDATALTHMMPSSMHEKEARGLLAGLGLTGKTVSDVPIAMLSGGQKARLALAELLVSPPHLLILDEVTTHLDSDSVIALARALKGYEGAIMLVTHDRFFMRCVIEGMSTRDFGDAAVTLDGGEEESDSDGDTDRGSVYEMRNGRLTALEGGIAAYEQGHAV